MRAVFIFGICIFFGLFSNISAQFNYENSLDRAIATGFQELYTSGDLVQLYAEFVNISEAQAATLINYTCPATTFANRTRGNDLDLFLRRGVLDIVVDFNYLPYESYDNETGEFSGIFITGWRQIARTISDYYNTTLRVRFHPRTFDPYTFFAGTVTGEWYSEAGPYADGNVTLQWEGFGLLDFVGLTTVSCTWDIAPSVVAWKTSAFASYAALQASNATLAYSTGTFALNDTAIELGFKPLAFSSTADAFAAVQNGDAQAILESYVNLVVVPGFSFSTYSIETLLNFTAASGFLLKVRADDIAPPPAS